MCITFIQRRPNVDVGSTLYKSHTNVLCLLGGAVVKAACLKSWRSRVQTPLCHSSCKETRCFLPAHSHRFNIISIFRRVGSRILFYILSQHLHKVFVFFGWLFSLSLVTTVYMGISSVGQRHQDSWGQWTTIRGAVAARESRSGKWYRVWKPVTECRCQSSPA